MMQELPKRFVKSSRILYDFSLPKGKEKGTPRASRAWGALDPSGSDDFRLHGSFLGNDLGIVDRLQILVEVGAG